MSLIQGIKWAILLFILLSGIFFEAPLNVQSFKLNILHTNDMHSRFLETCINKNTSNEKCYGGFPRLVTLINQAKKSDNSTIFLNAGDTYQGTYWFTKYKWEVVARGLNMLKPDAMCLGNHEFDNGINGLIPFLENASYPVLAANLDLTEEPELAVTGIKNSTILTVNDYKIGIIGYLTNQTKLTSSSRNVKFLDEVTVIQEEANKLKADGIDILIALGHSGYKLDKIIAEQVDGIDLVIGGHSHTFLYSGNQSNYDTPEGPYPTKIKQKNGKIVYVVQASAYTKYMGHVVVNYDEKEKKVINITGSPILVDDSIENDKDAVAEFEEFRLPIKDVEEKIVGSSLVLLDGKLKNCQLKECNFGNLITDAMIDYANRQDNLTGKWKYPLVAFVGAGYIRDSIDQLPSHKITMGEVLTVFPFVDTVLLVEIPGKLLLDALEWSAYNAFKSNYAFLQLSGIKVTYNLGNPFGSRVISAQVRSFKGRIPHFEDIDKDKNYTTITTDYIHTGGDGYTMFKNLEWYSLNITGAEVLAQYLQIHSPVYPGIESRINFVSTQNSTNN
ncbi:hypothetical protein HCN44_006207 [Aphidius gifuensis]|uniref:Uncharacterized protein n=1 Tax=Aphidius gifuensis TaxID=684658 RepID=A0A834Y6W5_APHGI|nr:protein 5NUC-like [Aphidius gifuensis]XP_044009505.1 protein 5NUC-like [Aphidius gifuensis]XP_044009514.1 protein 5NUC-like [Aphidius gifuensis]KAF7997636.1 hypothetical protein HCN44_006207 [Aphidius gifuensis]